MRSHYASNRKAGLIFVNENNHRYLILRVILIYLTFILFSCAPAPGSGGTPAPPPPPTPTPSGSCITPIKIIKPVHSGTRVIAYTGGTRDCDILVTANNVVIGHGTVSAIGSGELLLNRSVAEGEILFAKQSQNGYPSINGQTVENFPSAKLINSGEKFDTPTINKPVYACQRGIIVNNLLEGVRANGSFQSVNSSKYDGVSWTPYQSTFVGSGQLNEGDSILGWQDLDINRPMKSDSTTAQVEKLPSTLEEPDYLAEVGSDVIGLWKLVPGAEVSVTTVDKNGNEKRVGGGIATSDRNWIQIDSPVQKDLKYIPHQSLCGLQSPTTKAGDAYYPKEISTPLDVFPMCPGDSEVLVDNTSLGALVQIRVNRNDQGSATAPPGTRTIVFLTGYITLKANDIVNARQSNHAYDSGWTKDFTVSATVEECQKKKEEYKIQHGAYFDPTAGANMGTIGGGGSGSQSGSETCTVADSPCEVQPLECNGRGPNWKVTGKCQKENGKLVCKVQQGVDYCKSCGGDCGNCYGNSCVNDSQCIPGNTCKKVMTSENDPGKLMCMPIGLGCTPVNNLCWTKEELGKAQLGCTEGQGQ